MSCRLIKDQFHASADEHKAHLVSVVGIAGIGKSRLSWEFFKYIDGIAELVYTHRGRCLAYGEGVTYWALAEMVRMRAGITDGEDPASALTKLQRCLVEFLSDADERRWVEPRLAQLLALEDRAAHDREDLFSAWRLFFERLADKHPTVLVFEDMQWADTSLLEFIEYLMEWSRNHALYVVTSARPELVDRHPTWGAGKRNFTSVFLEPLAAQAMEQLLDSLVPGLPDELREQILQRAEGVPLYAVETVRMLLDRGLLERAGSVYRMTGPVEDLEVPQSLHGLIAARLDGLRPEARRVLQDAAVLGKTFSVPSLAAVSGVLPSDIQPLLAELVRKEVLSVQADPPLSGARPVRVPAGPGEARRVRDSFKARPERKASGGRGLVRELVGRRGGRCRRGARLALPRGIQPRAPGSRRRSGQVSRRGRALPGRRARSISSLPTRRRNDISSRRRAWCPTLRDKQRCTNVRGRWRHRGGRNVSAIAHLERAVSLYESENLPHPAARALSRLGLVESVSGQLDGSIQRMERAYAVLADDAPDEDLATLAVRLASLLHFKGDPDTASKRVEVALDIGEKLGLPEILSQALNIRAMLAMQRRHDDGGDGALRSCVATWVSTTIFRTATIRAHFNLADLLCHRDRLPGGACPLPQRSRLSRGRSETDRTNAAHWANLRSPSRASANGTRPPNLRPRSRKTRCAVRRRTSCPCSRSARRTSNAARLPNSKSSCPGVRNSSRRMTGRRGRATSRVARVCAAVRAGMPKLWPTPTKPSTSLSSWAVLGTKTSKPDFGWRVNPPWPSRI